MNSDKEIADIARDYVKACKNFQQSNVEHGSKEYFLLYNLCDKLYDILEHLVEKEEK